MSQPATGAVPDRMRSTDVLLLHPPGLLLSNDFSDQGRMMMRSD